MPQVAPTLQPSAKPDQSGSADDRIASHATIAPLSQDSKRFERRPFFERHPALATVLALVVGVGSGIVIEFLNAISVPDSVNADSQASTIAFAVVILSLVITGAVALSLTKRPKYGLIACGLATAGYVLVYVLLRAFGIIG